MVSDSAMKMNILGGVFTILRLVLSTYHVESEYTQMCIVFAGPVAGTEKKTETEPNATKSNWTIGRGCLVWELFRLPVVLLFKNSKTDTRPEDPR